jgi:prolyl-tRNA synthetase
MRMTRLFSQTLREIPADAEVASQQLLVRAGFIRQLGAGLFSYLPLARRSLTRIEKIMRAEMDAIGGQEITIPMATHEEAVVNLVRSEIRSYRQLPCLIYHFQTRWRDDPHPRAGLIRPREFTRLDSYSLDADRAGLEVQYRAHYDAYLRIFGRCGLPVLAAQSEAGMTAGETAQGFVYLTPVGEEELILCDGCGYEANWKVAAFAKPQPAEEAPRPLEKVATPHTTTIAGLAALLGVPESRTAKAVFMVATDPKGFGNPSGLAGERFIFAVIRGDMEVNEAKLACAVSARVLRPATEAEIRAASAVPGYASPIGLKKVLVVVDDLIPHAPNLVAGANEEGYHLLNVNYGRDYTADLVCDIAAARDGAPCPQCGTPLRSARGVEVGHISQPGTCYSEAMECTYHDRDGADKPVVIGSYQMSSSRLLACIAEEHHDDKGLIWPLAVAPYQLYLVSLPGAEAEAERLYAQLWSAGVEVLLDDRAESAGVKFNDADLIGLPLRLTIGKRSLQTGGADLKRRDRSESALVPLDEIVTRVRQELAKPIFMTDPSGFGCARA